MINTKRHILKNNKGKTVYICIHCPDVQSQEPGYCSQCGMELKKLSEIDD